MVLLMAAFLCTSMQQHESEPLSKRKQKAWIREMKKDLARASVDANLPLIEPAVVNVKDYQSVTYRVQARSKIICTNGDWLVIHPHSSHQADEVGDICLALTDKGKFYVNYGHVCGGIIHFQSLDTIKPASAEDFISRFRSDTDDKAWK